MANLLFGYRMKEADLSTQSLEPNQASVDSAMNLGTADASASSGILASTQTYHHQGRKHQRAWLLGK
jgi:hypothetical protein